LPTAVVTQIRKAVLEVLGPAAGTLLDLGAGTGRLGRAFVAAKDAYVGFDRSLGMLGQFKSSAETLNEAHPRLVQGDGSFLPFRSGSFRVVLLAHVLSAFPDWSALLAEARRILEPGGVLVLAQRVGPEHGLDDQMRKQLKVILAEMNVEMPEAGKTKKDARSWLRSVADGHQHVVAARWKEDRTPGEFLERHSTGARFAALPAEVRRESLERLRHWATLRFGAVETPFVEEHSFALDAFRFGEPRP
jgi:ubiquinone/menaquinone biosynthesis C-methylase UbiE